MAACREGARLFFWNCRLSGGDLSGNKRLASEDTIFSRDLYFTVVSSRGLGLLYDAIEMLPTYLSHISPCQLAGNGPSSLSQTFM